MCDCKVRLERLERWADKVETALQDLSGRTRRDSENDIGTGVPYLSDEKFNDPKESDNGGDYGDF